MDGNKTNLEFEIYMYRTEAIILKKQDAGEADRIFTCYSKEFGKIRILARGARKAAGKLKCHLEPLTHSEISFVFGKNYSAEVGSASGRKILTGARSLDVFPSVKSDLFKLNRAYYFAGLIDCLIAGEERDEKIWNLFSSSLVFLDSSGPAIDDSRAFSFLFAVLDRLGYLPKGGEKSGFVLKDLPAGQAGRPFGNLETVSNYYLSRFAGENVRFAPLEVRHNEYFDF